MEYCKAEIYEMISNVLNVDNEIIANMDENDDFAIHGMDSSSAIQLIIKIEGKYDFEFKDEDLFIDKFNTLKKLLDLLTVY